MACPGSLCKIKSKTPRPEAPHSPALTSHPFPMSKPTYRESPQKHRNAAGMPAASSSPVAAVPGHPPQRRSNSDSAERSISPPFQRYLKPRSGFLNTGLGVGFLFREQATWYYSTEKEHYL